MNEERNATRQALPLAEHPELELVCDFAVVNVVPVSLGEEPEIIVTSRHGGRSSLHDQPRVVVAGAGGVTRVRVDGATHGSGEPHSHGRFWEAAFWDKRRFRHHHLAIELRVPSNVRGSLRSAATRMNVANLEGCDLRIQAEAGSVTLDDVSGRLDVATQAGRIDGNGLRGAINVSTSAGAIRLEILSLDPGTHRVRTTMGAAQVALAMGMPVQVDTRTAMGSSRVHFDSVRGAEAVLAIEADLGAIRVHTSRRPWSSASGPVPESPYRRAATPVREAASESAPPDDEEIQQILSRVADGTLSPMSARELLREMGWS